jgi:chemotaxis methyl-accepting protein methylase
MARLKCADAHNVEFIQAQLPAGPWERPADLIVLSEILYYLDAPAIERLASRLLRCASDADMLLVHWTGETNYPLSGDDATERFLQSMGSREVGSVRSPQYRLDVVHGQAFPKDHR